MPLKQANDTHIRLVLRTFFEDEGQMKLTQEHKVTTEAGWKSVNNVKRVKWNTVDMEKTVDPLCRQKAYIATTYREQVAPDISCNIVDTDNINIFWSFDYSNQVEIKGVGTSEYTNTKSIAAPAKLRKLFVKK